MDLVTLALAKKYTKESLEGAGAIQGKSAYEIATEEGFNGTEKEWIESLKGENYIITEDDKIEIANIVSNETQEDLIKCLDAVSTDEKVPLTYTGKYIATNGSIGSKVDITNFVESTYYRVWILPVKSGDVYTVAAKSGSAPRQWAFLDTEYTLLSHSAANANTISNPINLRANTDGYLIINVTSEARYTVTRKVQIKSVDLVNTIEIKADKTQLARTDRSLEYLWKKSKGIIYDTENVESTVTENVVPSGAMEYAELQMVGGMSRKGRNLVKNLTTSGTSNSITFTKNADGTVTATGTASATSSKYISTVTLHPGTYVLSGCPSGGASGKYGLGLYRQDGTTVKGTDYGDKYIFTVSEEEEIVTVRIRYWYDYNLNHTFRPMIQFASDADSTYEPYTDQLIDSKVDKIVTVGKNLIDASKITINSGASMGSTGLAVGNSSTWKFLMDYIPVHEDTTYTLSANPLGTSGWTSKLAFYDENKSFISMLSKTNASKIWTFTTPSNARYIRYSGANLSKTDLMLEIGETNAQYSPYKESITIVPETIQQLPDYGIGISADCYNYVDYANKQYHRRVGIVDLGTLSWRLVSNKWWQTNILAEMKPASGMDAVGNILAEKYKTFSWNDSAIAPAIAISNSSTKLLSVQQDDIENTPTGIMYFQRSSEEIIDISDLLTDEDWSILQTESGGTVSFHCSAQDEGYTVEVPNTIEYMVEVEKV